MSEHDTYGRQVSADFWEVDFDILDSLEYIIASMELAVKKCGATLIGKVYHKFEPNGVTYLGLLAESHIAIHTYPSRGFASICCYCCGSADPELAIDYLIEAFKPKEVYRKNLIRGVR